MVLTKRTKCSLAQFMDMFNASVVVTLLDKYDISSGWGSVSDQTGLTHALSHADSDKLGRLLEEIAATYRYLRNSYSPKGPFDERWKDLTKCLLLDGYHLEEGSIARIEPFLEGTEPIEDDLTEELERSGLAARGEVKKQIADSANDFKAVSPDYNGGLSHARIALETLIRDIAKNKGLIITEANEKNAWGLSLRHLQEEDFINKKQENALASVYTLISPGSHVPIGFTEEEYVRFGRNLAISMCYFAIKLFNGKNGTGTVPF